MPYIPSEDRAELDHHVIMLAQKIFSPGELNYVITRLCDLHSDPLSYKLIAEITGVLENVKQEFYRRKVTPYEDKKIKENGDVY